MIKETPVRMYTVNSIPIATAIEYDNMNREFGANPPIERVVGFVQKCIIDPTESKLVYELTSGEFHDLLEEWTAKSAE